LSLFSEWPPRSGTKVNVSDAHEFQSASDHFAVISWQDHAGSAGIRNRA